MEEVDELQEKGEIQKQRKEDEKSRNLPKRKATNLNKEEHKPARRIDNNALKARLSNRVKSLEAEMGRKKVEAVLDQAQK